MSRIASVNTLLNFLLSVQEKIVDILGRDKFRAYKYYGEEGLGSKISLVYYKGERFSVSSIAQLISNERAVRELKEDSVKMVAVGKILVKAFHELGDEFFIITFGSIKCVLNSYITEHMEGKALHLDKWKPGMLRLTEKDKASYHKYASLNQLPGILRVFSDVSFMADQWMEKFGEEAHAAIVPYMNRTILLFDDTFNTGASTAFQVEVLRRLGVEKIVVLTLLNEAKPPSYYKQEEMMKSFTMSIPDTELVTVNGKEFVSLAFLNMRAPMSIAPVPEVKKKRSLRPKGMLWTPESSAQCLAEGGKAEPDWENLAKNMGRTVSAVKQRYLKLINNKPSV